MRYIDEYVMTLKGYIAMWNDIIKNPRSDEITKKQSKANIEDFQELVDIMEKSIPAEKIHEHGEEYRCSRCGTIVYRSQKYCHDCGQKLEEGRL